MLDPWSVVTTRTTTQDEAELKQLYGEDAIISQVGIYNLIHLDAPSPDEVQRRVQGFDPEQLLDDHCPICRMMRGQGLDVVFMRSREQPSDE